MLLVLRWQYLPNNGCGGDCVTPDVWMVLSVVGPIVVIGLLYSFVFKKWLDRRR